MLGISKNLILALSLLLFDQQLSAQGTVINKLPSAPVTFAWIYQAADESKITGYEIVQLAKGAATAETVVGTYTPAVRKSSGLTAPTLGGQYSYVVRAYFNTTATPPIKLLSANSSEATVNVVVLPVPTGLSVQ